ncbi:hypothetical protein DFH07DRAFT_779282 [Mycena maculata]|uniref:Uncharacterized protein n=1 Tax=Mycena maculata TaxID=230809 RepID=A0AAD7MXQ5_9AGAR|nr:hypothetical protein DFH07DRAFT_779282 [Mycena maculata]
MTRRCNCGICGSSLVSQIAKGGKAPGSEFVQCTNHNPPWFYRFLDAHNTPASIALPIMHTPAAIAPPPVPPPPMVSKPTCLYTCGGHRCGNTRVPPLCSRQMCKKHCNITGPCRLPTHDKKRREKEDAASLQPAPLTNPVHQHVPTPARDNTNALHALADDVYATTTAPLRALDVWQRGEDERTARENRRLDAVLGIHSPSPELSLGEEIECMEAQIAADHALAQQLSQDLTYEDNLVADTLRERSQFAVFFPPVRSEQVFLFLAKSLRGKLPDVVSQRFPGGNYQALRDTHSSCKKGLDARRKEGRRLGCQDT